MDGLDELVDSMLPGRSAAAMAGMKIDPAARVGIDTVPRATLAMALGVILFDDLLQRVPTAADYVRQVRADGGELVFDHGALRTIDLGSETVGALPGGIKAFARILEPLGYVVARTYPLPALKMTGYAFVHRDLPESVPQYFVSELHVGQFPEPFHAPAMRVFGQSRDPLGAAARGMLSVLASGTSLAIEQARGLLAQLVAAFGRQHAQPSLDDYEALRHYSAEAAWIATEGNAFNHATDRVLDVGSLARRQREIGRPIKDRVEVSTNGRVKQTAFRADPVLRAFDLAGGGQCVRSVPGSFYEFITRETDPDTGKLDLSFDSSNAQGIFAMTAAN